MTREIEERGGIEEVWGGRLREGAVSPDTLRLAARDPRARAPREAGAERPARAPRPGLLGASGARGPETPRATAARAVADWLPFASLRRALGRERGVRWRTLLAPPLAARADATALEGSLARTGPRARHPDLTPVLLRALGSALRAFPGAGAIVPGLRPPRRRPVHVGVALYTERGLRVPVVREADRKSAQEIETELGELARRAREAEQPEWADCTITFCDLGVLGREDLPGHLLAGRGLVLGVGELCGEPRRARGRLEVRRMLPLTLAVGHGGPARAEAGRLLRWLVRAIEDPRLLAFAS